MTCHASVTQAVGKRVVGKQNILPLLRDAAEDSRTVKVAIDTENRRYKAEILAVSGTTKEHVILKLSNPRRNTDRTSLQTSRILAFSIVEVSAVPDSEVGQRTDDLRGEADR